MVPNKSKTIHSPVRDKNVINTIIRKMSIELHQFQESQRNSRVCSRMYVGSSIQKNGGHFTINIVSVAKKGLLK